MLIALLNRQKWVVASVKKPTEIKEDGTREDDDINRNGKMCLGRTEKEKKINSCTMNHF